MLRVLRFQYSGNGRHDKPVSVTVSTVTTCHIHLYTHTTAMYNIRERCIEYNPFSDCTNIEILEYISPSFIENRE